MEANELIRDQVTKAANYLAFETSHSYLQMMASEPPKTHSVLEEIFRIWWEAVFFMRTDGFALEPQVSISAGGSKYRADFVIHQHCLPNQQRPVLAIVELDGHEFHEKTRQQVERRNRRDRDLLAAGYPVVHFSFTEVVNDAKSCVLEAYSIAAKTYLSIGPK